MNYLQNTAVRIEKEYPEQNLITSLYEIMNNICDRAGGDNDELIIATTLAYLEAGNAVWINPPSSVDFDEAFGIA